MTCLPKENRLVHIGSTIIMELFLSLFAQKIKNIISDKSIIMKYYTQLSVSF